jgi:Ca2+-dependent lipid-binding protein
VRFFIAENLPIMDTMFGTIDAYVKLTYAGSKLKTKVYKMKDNRVEWFQEMKIPVTYPILDDKLKFEIFDEDAVSDELACTV